ncbi:MAG: hypothetical protein ACI4V5_01460 [Prevotella sp.]
MKTRFFLMACIAMLAFGTSQVQAQGLGGLLKKGKKALETVNNTLNNTENGNQDNSTTKSSGTAVALPGGGTLTNPLSQIIDVQLVGVYGKSTSTNYGTVHLVFKVKMIENRNSIRFGVNVNYPGLMIDQDGNTYKTQESAGWYNYSVTEGIYMKLPVDKTWFADVKKTATTIQQLQIGISAEYNKTGLLVLKNVPIQWDVEP